MLHKIIKRGHGHGHGHGHRHRSKVAKSDVDFASKIVVNHASRGVAPPSLSIPHDQTTCAAAAPQRGAGQVTIENLPMFREVSALERESLLVRKLRVCFLEFDYCDTEIKKQTLVELVDYIQSGVGKITEANQEEMIRMISANIFRSLPPEVMEVEELEAVQNLDPSWPHLQLVYEVLLRYVVSPDTDTKVAKRYIDHCFVLKLLNLFESEDPREREYLKTIVHRIYGKFMVHRPFIRKAINNIFYRFIYEKHRHSGIGELLEILGSIINGFALPMKEEHKLFLARVLIPLHKPKALVMYHRQLSYCITQFVEKDYKLADVVIMGLLKYWPHINSQKELLFIGELEDVLEATQPVEFQRCLVPLFRQIARSINSPHFQVAERALYLWNSDHFIGLISGNGNIKVVLPIIYEALEKNMESPHWNQAVQGLTFNVRKMFADMDGELFAECGIKYAKTKASSRALKQRRLIMWQRLAAAAAQGWIID